MEFDISCSNCRAELTAEEEMIGTKLNCPACDHTITVKKAVNTIKGEVKDKKYPSECNGAGMCLILFAVYIGYIWFRHNPYVYDLPSKPLLVVTIACTLISGRALFSKMEFGAYLGIVSLILTTILFFFFYDVTKLFNHARSMIAGGVYLAMTCSIIYGINSFFKWKKSPASGEEILAACPQCSTKMVLKESALNKTIKCVHCEDEFQCVI